MTTNERFVILTNFTHQLIIKKLGAVYTKEWEYQPNADGSLRLMVWKKSYPRRLPQRVPMSHSEVIDAEYLMGHRKPL